MAGKRQKISTYLVGYIRSVNAANYTREIQKRKASSSDTGLDQKKSKKRLVLRSVNAA